jgi:hypothetical protein
MGKGLIKLTAMNKKVNNMKQIVEIHKATDNKKESLIRLLNAN